MKVRSSWCNPVRWCRPAPPATSPPPTTARPSGAPSRWHSSPVAVHVPARRFTHPCRRGMCRCRWRHRCSMTQRVSACMPDLTHARRGPHLTASALVQSLPPATRYILRGGAAVRATAAQALALQLPANACRAMPDGERAALWLGPDEWLLIAREGSAASLAAALSDALAALPHSLVDVSHRQIA